MNRPACGKSLIHGLADTFLDNELGCDESVAFTSHLADCAELAHMVAGRKAMRDRLRAAAKSTHISPGLETRIKARIREERVSRWNVWPVLALAAAVLLALGINFSWRNGNLRFTPASQQAYIDSLRPGLSPVMQVGLQQHVHCAVYRKLTSPYPTLEEMAQALGPGEGELVAAMQAHIPANYRVAMAHRCDFHGREYVHLIATDGSHRISLLVTNRAQGEAFENDLKAVATESEMSLYTSSAQRFEISGFETRDHLIYLVSDLDPARNFSAFTAMVPEIARTIRTHET